MKKLRQKTMILAAVLAVSMILPAGAAGDDEQDAVSQVKEAFNEAMGKPLEQRVGELENLERLVDDLLFSVQGNGSAKVDLLMYRYRVQRALAKFPESRATFGQYVAAVKNAFSPVQARTIIETVINRHFHRDSGVECVELINEALDEYKDDSHLTPLLLLRKGEVLSQLNGRYYDAFVPLKQLIAEYPESEWRPDGMRLLANLQTNSGQLEKAFGTLALMEEQYQGSWYSHYAHMRPAAIMEVRQGNVEGAIQRYRESLEKYPDHCFSVYIRGEIERLQEVLEQQLIDLALDGLAKEDSECESSIQDMLIFSKHESDNYEDFGGRASALSASCWSSVEQFKRGR